MGLRALWAFLGDLWLLAGMENGGFGQREGELAVLRRRLCYFRADWWLLWARVSPAGIWEPGWPWGFVGALAELGLGCELWTQAGARAPGVGALGGKGEATPSQPVWGP